MLRRASGGQSICHPHHGKRLDIHTSGGDIRREKCALFKSDPRRPIAAQLRLEHEAERGRQVGGGLLTGQLDQSSSQIAQPPGGKLWKG